MEAISTCLMLVGLLSFNVRFSAGSDAELGTLKQIATGPEHVWAVNTNNEIFSRQVNSATSYGEWIKQPWSNKQAISVGPNGHIWALGTNNNFVYRREGITDDKPEGSNWKSLGTLRADKVAAGKSGLWVVQFFSSGQRLYHRIGSYGGSGHHGRITAWSQKSLPEMALIIKLFVGPSNVWLLDRWGKIFRLPVMGDTNFGLWQLYDDSRESVRSPQMIKGIAVSPAGNMWAVLFNQVSRGAGEDPDATGSKWILDNDQLNLIDISAGKVGVWGTDGRHVYYRSETYSDEYEIAALTGSWDVVT